MNNIKFFYVKDRVRASAIHFSLSVLATAMVAWLVFFVWYPYPYSEISGGRELFVLLVLVDVFVGPLMTFLIFNKMKPFTELRRDLSVIALLQISALGYGLWTVAMARPVHIVFEIDRFRIVQSIEVPEELLSKAPPDIKIFPITGPTALGLRSFKNDRERFDMTMEALQGISLSARPDLWQSYDKSRGDVIVAAKPIDQLRLRYPDQESSIDSFIFERGMSRAEVRYLPLVGRKSVWTVLVDARNGDLLGYIPLDSF